MDLSRYINKIYGLFIFYYRCHCFYDKRDPFIFVNRFWFKLTGSYPNPLRSICSLTHSFPMHPFSTSWKHHKSVRFSVFRGQRKGALGTNGLN